MREYSGVWGSSFLNGFGVTLPRWSNIVTVRGVDSKRKALAEITEGGESAEIVRRWKATRKHLTANRSPSKILRT